MDYFQTYLYRELNFEADGLSKLVFKGGNEEHCLGTVSQGSQNWPGYFEHSLVTLLRALKVIGSAVNYRLQWDTLIWRM